MREEKAVPEYCKNNPKKIRAYQCDICDVLDVDDFTDKRFAGRDFGPVAATRTGAGKRSDP